MSEWRWNLWKLTAIGMALVVVTAVVTGLVVASWSGKEKTQETKPTTAASGPPPRTVPKPSAADIEACNQYAQSQVGDKTAEVVKDAVIGGVLGAGAGAVGGAVTGGRKGNVQTGAAIGGIVGATAGTLYGINEANKHDERHRQAYQTCMKGRGYTE